jgi:tetratricopeptide (TPR) repeat protein
MEGGDLTAIAKHRNAEPPRLIHLVRGDLDWIVMKCLEKDRARRYDTANGLAMDARRHLENEPVIARPPSAAYRIQKAWRRNKTAFTAAALVALVLAVATGISVWQATVAKERMAESEAISKFLTQVFQSPDPARDGRTITVAETLSNAATMLESNLANHPARRAKLQATLGLTYHALGLDREANPLLEKVRDYYLAASGPEHPDTLTAMHNLAISYDYFGRREEALKLREQVLALRRKICGPEDPDTLLAMNSLAISYHEAGRRDQALKLREELPALCRKVNGPEHTHTLQAMHNLANSYDDAGQRNEALTLREQVLPLRRKVNGPEHPDTLLAMNNLAVSYDEVGRGEEALKLREEVLALRRKVNGPEHPDTLLAMSNLATSYEEAGRGDEAIKLREEVLALRRKVSGAEHPDTLSMMHNLASSYEYLGRRDKALTLREEVLALRRKVLGPEHPETLSAMHNLANSYDVAGRRDEALKLREQVLPLRRKVNGPEHPDTLQAMNNLAASYYEAGRWEDAIKLQEQTLALRSKVLGPEHSDTLLTMRNLALSYDEAGRRDEALKLMEEVLSLRLKVSGPQHAETLMTIQYLANSYFSLGRNTEAIALLEKAGEADPKDTLAWLRLASCQIWFGQEADYEATRRRVVQQAEGTDQASTAERAARVCCLRPSTDAALLAKALNLARRAVELGKSDPALPWNQLALGIAEYRNGQYAAAEETLAAVEQTAAYDVIQGSARVFRAMSLFRQNRTEEARSLFSQAEAGISPPPKDESRPLVDGKPVSHDWLILWLVYKEAKSALNESPAKP